MEPLKTPGGVEFSEVPSDGPLNVFFYDRLIGKGFRQIASASWPCDGKPTISPEDIGLEVVLRWEHQTTSDWLLQTEDAVVHLDVGPHFIIRVAASSIERARRIIATFREIVPALIPVADDGRVPVSFWTYSPRGPQQHVRMIDAHEWEGITSNYNRDVTEQLSYLMGPDFRPAFGGQLILWHGPPGTGKTHALRALAWEWRNWADFHYVVDPEALFGQHADYLLSILLSESDEVDPDDDSKPRWKVLLLEDTGEMLAADAKDRVGQALSRLLNTVDGFIGQGLRVLVIVTTNEHITTLHPAVARPGRCAARILFDKLSSEEAKLWLAENGGDPEQISNAQTLAELYGVKDGYTNESQQLSLVGFGT